MSSTTQSSSRPALPAVERARRYLCALPAAVSGENGHGATFRAACAMIHGFGLTKDAAYALLAGEFNPRCQPKWTAAELEHKISDAGAALSDKPAGYLLDEPTEEAQETMDGSRPKWPEPDPREIARIIAAGPTALELWKRSPLPLDAEDCRNGGELDQGLLIEALFDDSDNPDPLLCLGKNNAEFATRPLSKWLESGKLGSLALIVPSPMTARTGRTKAGKVSEHTLANTGARRYLVVEFDQGSADDHAARLWHLAGFAPLTLVAHSGSKSLHGWFYCAGQTEPSLRKFMAYAVSIGADKATWTRSQFVRLPGGRRENGARQDVFYFDPRPIPSLELAVTR